MIDPPILSLLRRRTTHAIAGLVLLAVLCVASFYEGLRDAAASSASLIDQTQKHVVSGHNNNSSAGANLTLHFDWTISRDLPSPTTNTPSVPSASSSVPWLGMVDDDPSSSSVTPWFAPNLCERQQIIDGRWVPVRLKRLPYYPPSNNTRCNLRALFSPRGWDTHRWVPKNRSCTLGDWDAATFCQLTKHATILIMGDSLSWENYVSTIHLLGIKATHMYSRMSKDFRMNVGHAVCDGFTRMVYRRNDYLESIRHALLENNTHIPQIIVLNRGAHYIEDNKFMVGLKSSLDVVEEWLDHCDALKITCHFFWRTTVPGHLNCRSFKKPVNDKAKMEAYVGNLSNYDKQTLKFHWYDFQHQNLMVEAELSSRTKLHGRYRMLDGYHINVLRPDAHSDCLHSCCPGKMDVYAQLLLHYLRIDRTRQDVEQLRQVFEEHHWDVNVTTPYVFCPSCQ